jgi:hypothetical protein
MTLKEKFIKCRNKLNQYYVLPITDDAEQLEKIADDYAIEFLKWCEMKMVFSSSVIHKPTYDKLLLQFKKEKGL